MKRKAYDAVQVRPMGGGWKQYTVTVGGEQRTAFAQNMSTQELKAWGWRIRARQTQQEA